VLAIGSPFGLQATVTAGIISAKEPRRPWLAKQFQRFLQTDAAINPGNSGGPLVDLAGKSSASTLPSSLAAAAMKVLASAPIEHRHQYLQPTHRQRQSDRGSIGVSFQEDLGTNPITLKSLGAPYGVVIELVEPGGPAEKAGLKAGDVITRKRPTREDRQRSRESHCASNDRQQG